MVTQCEHRAIVHHNMSPIWSCIECGMEATLDQWHAGYGGRRIYGTEVS